jgi:hypothetical protein
MAHSKDSSAATVVGPAWTRAARQKRAWSSRMSMTQTSDSSARRSRVASICHRSLGEARSKRCVAGRGRARPGATKLLRESARWMDETAGGLIPSRRSSARIRRAPHLGCSFRRAQMTASTSAFMRWGCRMGTVERGSSPSIPSARNRRR